MNPEKQAVPEVRPQPISEPAGILDSLDWERFRSGTRRALNPDNQPMFDKYLAHPISEQGSDRVLTDEQIITIRKAVGGGDPVKQWGASIAFARAIIAALATSEREAT